jgi:hypothetical protein
MQRSDAIRPAWVNGMRDRSVSAFRSPLFFFRYRSSGTITNYSVRWTPLRPPEFQLLRGIDRIYQQRAVDLSSRDESHRHRKNFFSHFRVSIRPSHCGLTRVIPRNEKGLREGRATKGESSHGRAQKWQSRRCSVVRLRQSIDMPDSRSSPSG